MKKKKKNYFGEAQICDYLKSSNSASTKDYNLYLTKLKNQQKHIDISKKSL